MSFKQEILAALQSGPDHRTLLEIVQRHHMSGLTREQAYEQLEEIWRNFGFHEKDEPSALQDELEYVLERVWYGYTLPD